MRRSSDDAPYDVRAFDRIDLVGEDDEDGSSSGISESVIFRDWQNPFRVCQFSGCCSAYFGPCWSANQLYNQKVAKLMDFANAWSYSARAE